MSYIEVIVLKPFPYSEDGYTTKYALAHATIDLPERLFSGLNKEGYVRRAVIGDGHVSLRGNSAFFEAEQFVDVLVDGTVVDASAKATPAPQPPVRTADLTEEEDAALADGSWRDKKFFWKRSVAAKLSTSPIVNGDDANAAIEAELERRASGE